MGLGHGGQNFLGGQGRVFGEIVLGQQHHKLVATLPAHGVRTAHAGRQALRHRLQQAVANAVAEGIVDQLEVVQIEKQHAQMATAPLGHGNRLADPVVEQHPVGQVGEKVMLGQIGHFQGRGLGIGNVVKDDDRTTELTIGIVNGRRGVFNRALPAIATNQDGAGGQLHFLVLLQHQLDGVAPRLTGGAIDDLHHHTDGLTPCVLALPAGQLLGRHIQVVDVAIHVGADHRIADRVEGYLGARLFHKHAFFNRLALDDVAQRLRHQITLEITFGQIALGPALHRQVGQFLLLGAAENQNRNLWRSGKQLIKGGNALAVRQAQIDQNHVDIATVNARQSRRQQGQRLDGIGPVTGVLQYFTECLGIIALTGNDQYSIHSLSSL